MATTRRITRKPPPRPSKRVVQVSLGDLLAEIDADEETRQEGRSAFIRKAVSLYLQAKKRHEIDQSIERAFGGKGDELEAEIRDIMGAQAWPQDE